MQNSEADKLVYAIRNRIKKIEKPVHKQYDKEKSVLNAVTGLPSCEVSTILCTNDISNMSINGSRPVMVLDENNKPQIVSLKNVEIVKKLLGNSNIKISPCHRLIRSLFDNPFRDIKKYALGLEVFKLILKHPGFDIRFDDNFTTKYVTINKHKEALKYILEDAKIDVAFDKNFLIKQVCLNGWFDIFELLILDERVNVFDSDNSSFMNACKCKNYDIIYVLLNHPGFNMDYSVIKLICSDVVEEITSKHAMRGRILQLLNEPDESEEPEDLEDNNEKLDYDEINELGTNESGINVSIPDTKESKEPKESKESKKTDSLLVKLYHEKTGVSFDCDEPFNEKSSNVCQAKTFLDIVKHFLSKSDFDPSFDNNFLLKYAAKWEMEDVIKLLLENEKVKKSLDYEKIDWSVEGSKDTKSKNSWIKQGGVNSNKTKKNWVVFE